MTDQAHLIVGSSSGVSRAWSVAHFVTCGKRVRELLPTLPGGFSQLRLGAFLAGEGANTRHCPKVDGLHGRLPDASARRSSGSRQVAAPAAGDGQRAHQKGEQVRVHHVFMFALARPVTQPVIPLNFPRAATVEEHPLQGEFPLFARMEGPAIVPPELMRTVKTYRQAVRLCWQLRRVRNLTFRQLAAEADLIYQHVTDYFNADDKAGRRDLPADKKDAVEAVLGNTAISQYLMRGPKFTVLEVVQAAHRSAA